MSRIGRVRKMYGDPEIGHAAEDELLAGFVRAVAAGEVEDPALVAEQIARHLLDAERERWYA